MKKFVFILAFVLVFIYSSISVFAENASDTANVSVANEVSAPEEPHKTGDMLNIIAFLLLAASAVAMIFVLFPKDRSF